MLSLLFGSLIEKITQNSCDSITPSDFAFEETSSLYNPVIWINQLCYATTHPQYQLEYKLYKTKNTDTFQMLSIYNEIAKKVQ